MTAIKNDNTTYVVISAEKADLSPRDNINRTEELLDILSDHGFTYTRGIGKYNGTLEESVLVSINNYPLVNTEDSITWMQMIAREFGQECILEIKQGHGWLRYTAGGEEYIGTMRPATETEDAYSKFGDLVFRISKDES
jgi:hypothetical protein